VAAVGGDTITQISQHALASGFAGVVSDQRQLANRGCKSTGTLQRPVRIFFNNRTLARGG